jgi:ubiquinone biosynthesis protein Coq4
MNFLFSGEVVVKWIEGIQTGLPMCVTGGIFGATRLRPKQRAKYVTDYLPWAIQVGFTARPLLHIYFEQRWDDSIYELRKYICPLLNNPPK